MFNTIDVFGILGKYSYTYICSEGSSACIFEGKVFVLIVRVLGTCCTGSIKVTLSHQQRGSSTKIENVKLKKKTKTKKKKKKKKQRTQNQSQRAITSLFNIDLLYLKPAV